MLSRSFRYSKNPTNTATPLIPAARYLWRVGDKISGVQLYLVKFYHFKTSEFHHFPFIFRDNELAVKLRYCYVKQLLHYLLNIVILPSFFCLVQIQVVVVVL